MSQEFCRLLDILPGFCGMGPVNTIRPRQNVHHFANGALKFIVLN